MITIGTKIKNMKINHIWMSPIEEGIIIFYSEDSLILGFYDIYADSFIKSYKLKEKLLYL